MNQQISTFLIEMLEAQYGVENTENIIKGYECKKLVTLRVNTLKSNKEKIKKRLDEAKIEHEEVLWYEDALIIKNAQEKEIQNLDIYENGEVYLQNLSSMIPPIILQPNAEENILDMTAAPGSKTTQIAALTQNKAFITACEMNSIRAERLKYNIEKQGVTCTYVMVQDSRLLNDFFSFDKILLDAPCSGSGTINVENPNLHTTFTKKLIEKTTKAQISLLKKAIKLLKSGQEMVYSTCSILACENEEIIQRAIKEMGVKLIPIKLDNMKNIPILPTKLSGTICVCPNEIYEGFFIAKLRKE